MDEPWDEDGYIETQTKQRTSYVCRDMAMHLRVSLYDRIPILAIVVHTDAEQRRHKDAESARSPRQRR
jgi:hypothetical protein